MDKTGNPHEWNDERSSALKLFSRISILIILLLFIWSCGDNSTGADDLFGSVGPGSFEAVVSGAESQNFSGVSLFGTQLIGEPVRNIFVLTLSSTTNNPNYSITVTIRDSNRPASGEHSIETYGSDKSGQFVVFSTQDDIRLYRSLSGEMVINNSSSERLQGELTFSAELQNDPESMVTVRARFNANCQQASFLTCD